MNIPGITQVLLKKGTTLLNPESIEIDPAISPENISPAAVIHPGCRIRGKNTLIGPNCIVGEEGPATVVNCQLEENVHLKAGFFSEATFLYGSSMGSGSHVRAETLLEEYASCAHTVGLKHTILMPFVTVGSLVNFCDCLMSGGTGKENHSEVGSSYIHFNFTPNQDKATPSLIGDVPRGVMLNQPPIFLGGQGGLVGPARIEFGTVIAAGAICRRDVTEPGKLVFGRSGDKPGAINFQQGVYGAINRILRNNFNYIGNLCGLKQWYSTVRTRLAPGEYGSKCVSFAIERIDAMILERVKRLDQLAEKLSTASSEHANFKDSWPRMKEQILALKDKQASGKNMESFLNSLQKEKTSFYIETVRKLSPESRRTGSAWLNEVTDSANSMLA